MSQSATTFRTDQPLLKDLLDQIERGHIQLPDFQRGWVWDDNHIRSLIASISLSYPIGAVMVMETGGASVRFKPRPVEGVLNAPPDPERLILDGQQRLTSLYLALKSRLPVKTRNEKGKPIDRVYYLDMMRCLDPSADREDAVVSLPPERKVTADFGREVVLDVDSPEKEFQSQLFPLDLVFDPSASSAWQRDYRRYYNYAADRMEFLDDFQSRVWMSFQQYKVPVIELLKETPKEAVCQVFEKVNTGGVSLSVFELVTATYAADDYSLRDDWDERRRRLQQRAPLLTVVDSTDFLTATTLLSTYRASRESGAAIGCKRKDILDKLDLDSYRKFAGAIEDGLLQASKFLSREKVFDHRSLPYKTQLVPLAVLSAVLADRFQEEGTRTKIARWYWCGVFGEMYGGSTEARFAFDIPEVVAWVDGGPEPRTIRDSNFAPLRLLSLQSRNSAAYKGMVALLMREGGHDFLNGDPIELTTYFDLAVDIHHVFPKAYCEKENLPRLHWNSVINKTPLTARTNRILGGRAPSTYLRSLLNNHDLTEDQLTRHLSSHQIDPGHLWTNDFPAFLHHRACRLLELIERATGKNITGREEEDVVQEFGSALYPRDLAGQAPA